jgi:hypothetical protein
MRELGAVIERLNTDRGASSLELERATASNTAALEQWYAKTEAREVAAITALRSVLNDTEVRSVLDEMVHDIEQWYALSQQAQIQAALENAVMLLECERAKKDDGKEHSTPNADDVSHLFQRSTSLFNLSNHLSINQINQINRSTCVTRRGWAYVYSPIHLLAQSLPFISLACSAGGTS